MIGLRADEWDMILGGLEAFEQAEWRQIAKGCECNTECDMENKVNGCFSEIQIDKLEKMMVKVRLIKKTMEFFEKELFE